MAAQATATSGCTKNGGLFFGTAKESDEGDAGVQSIGSIVVDVTPGEYFELIAPDLRRHEERRGRRAHLVRHRAVVCGKEGRYILYNFSGGFSWYLFGPEHRAELAKQLVEACVEIVGLRKDNLNLAFTQHAGDEMYHTLYGGLSDDWTAGEPDKLGSA